MYSDQMNHDVPSMMMYSMPILCECKFQKAMKIFINKLNFKIEIEINQLINKKWIR